MRRLLHFLTVLFLLFCSTTVKSQNILDIDDDNDGVLDDTECNTALSHTFPTTGGQTDVLQGWTVGGTYTAGAWSSGGRVHLVANGLEFRRDAGTVSSVSRTLTNLPANLELRLVGLYWFNTTGTGPTSTGVLNIKLNGVLYASINTGQIATSTPTITTSNGAIASLANLPSTPSSSLSTTTNLNIGLPNAALASAVLEFEFIAGSDPINSDDIGFAGLSMLACNVDTDNDGIFNHLDLDSDGDGCSDAIEAGSSITATSTTVFPTGTDTNANGLLNVYEGVTAGTINYVSTYQIYALFNSVNTCLDSDADLIKDVIDIDDDNDGVLDITEMNCTNSSVILNGSFELPVTLSASTAIPNSSMVGWQTTASDGIIEVWSSTYGVLGTPAEGVQMVELNGNMPASIYQPLNVQPGDLISWSVKHRARFSPSVDVAHVKIGATLATANLVQVMSSSSAGWVTYSGTYRVPLGQSTTFFVIESISTANNSPAAGNLLDDIKVNKECVDIFTDTDLIPNRLDLDSDNDACSDAIEAGSSTTATSTTVYATGTDTNGNGLLNVYEGATAGTINYTSTYYTYALPTGLNACTNTDNDGLNDLSDIDDDNDGVLDVTEGMCYDSQANYPLAGSTAYPIFYSYNSGLFDDWSSPAANNLIINPNNNPISGTNCTIAKNGINGNAIITNVNSANLATAKASNEYIGFSFTTKNNVFNASIEHLFYYREVASNYTMTWAISSDNINFVDLATSTYSGAVGSYPTNTVQMDISNYPLAPNATYFIRIYIYGLSSGTTAYIDNMGISFDWCDDIFTDADAIPNRLDLDSDGDGCSDAIEAGSSTTATSTTVYPTGTDTNGNGLLNGYEGSPSGTIFYTSNYYTYAVLAGVSACTDTDGDGIKDLSDIDDDNDGVLDVKEATACNNSTPGVSPNASWGQSVGLFFGFDSNLSDNYSGANNLVANPNSYAITASNCNIAASGSATITNVNSTSLTQAKSTNEYIGFSFTTKNNVFGASIEHFAYYRAFASTYTMTWAISSDNINFSDLTTNTYTGAVGGFPNNTVAINIPNYLLASNTTYYIRIYIYNISGGLTTAYIDDIGVAFDWCEELDTDGDNIANNLDLDSDNDSCSDAIEAGSSTTESSTTVYPAGTDTNGNGLLDVYESLSVPGEINYFTRYFSLAIDNSPNANACADRDNDGILDFVDIDDDNDGVLDTEEGCGSNLVLNHDFKTGWSGWTRVFLSPTNPDLNFLPSTATQATNGFYATWDQSWDFRLQSNLDVQTYDLLDIHVTVGKSQLHPTDRIEVRVGNNLRTFYTQDIPGSIGNPTTFNFQLPSNSDYPLISIRLIHDHTLGENDFNITSFHVTRVCEYDSESDGIPNYIDLDSDDDTCSDAIESGSSSTAVSVSVFPTGTDSNANGLLNVYEGGTAGTVNYNSTYGFHALQYDLNACIDTDSDGINDLNDLDDDNDGVLDHVESLDCYQTEADWNTENKANFVTVTTQLNTKNSPNGSYFSILTNDEATSTTLGFLSLANSPQPQLNKEIFKFSFAKPVRVTAIYIKKENATAIFGNVVSSLRLQGSNDNANWTNLTASAVGQPANASYTTQGGVSLINTDRFTVGQNGAPYKYYRIVGVAPANILGGNFSEVYFDFHSSYNASYVPKTNCNIEDTDGDNIANNLDLDSDNDSCSDAIESSSSTTETSTSVYTNGLDSNNNGLLNVYEGATDGTINYTSTYNTFALNQSSDNCYSLPIELVDFSSTCERDYVRIEWSTASEINNDYFTLEYSEDGINWVVLDKIDGLGNSNALINYSYNDYSIKLSETYYYRLSQTDYDGAQETFNIISQNCALQELTVFPNPADDELFILGISSGDQFTVTNTLSQTIVKFDATGSSYNLLLKNFSAGVYYIVQNTDEHQVIKKFTKK